MARITKNIYKNDETEILNFKDDNLDDSILKVRRESEDLLIMMKIENLLNLY